MQGHSATTVHCMRYDDLRTSLTGMFILVTPCAVALCMRAQETVCRRAGTAAPGSL